MASVSICLNLEVVAGVGEVNLHTGTAAQLVAFIVVIASQRRLAADVAGFHLFRCDARVAGRIGVVFVVISQCSRLAAVWTDNSHDMMSAAQNIDKKLY